MIIQHSLINPQRVCKPNDEWFTPPSLLALVKRTLGVVTWDLASCSSANQQVNALNYFSKTEPFQDLHHLHPWNQGFWCNPPFSQVGEFADIITDYRKKRGIVITNANTDTRWWHWLAQDADHLLLLNRRVAFVDPALGKPVSGNPKAQSLFFWGCTPEHFKGLGLIMEVKA